MDRRLPILFLMGLTLIVSAVTLHGAPPAKPVAATSAPGPKFLRLKRDDQGTVTALETAIVHYVPKDGDRGGLSVDLIGAVHIADKAYYDQLNKTFEQYDVLLYELVAPE
jgi:hypothetical protein